MINQVILPKYNISEISLYRYFQLYGFQVDYYQVDSPIGFGTPDEYKDNFEFYLDKVINYFSLKPVVPLSCRIGKAAYDKDKKEGVGWSLTTGFDLFVCDKELRDKSISVSVGDVVTSNRLFAEIATIKDFSQLTAPSFVRFVEDVEPASFVAGGSNILIWKITVSDTDVIFRKFA